VTPNEPGSDEGASPLPSFGPEPAAPLAVRPGPLLFSVLVVATCGLVYELISATMASYLLGDSVTQWSLIIGIYLSAMGLGSWLSSFVERQLHRRFVQIQLIVALVGGFSAPAAFLGFAYLDSVRPLLFAILVIVGTMVGLEIPWLMRIMEGGQTLKVLVARVLAFDYIGSLLASLLFPLVLLPHLGLVRTSLLFGLFNATVALWSMHAFRSQIAGLATLRLQAIAVTASLVVAFVAGPWLEAFGEAKLYDFPIIYSRKTPYQRLTITRFRSDLRLYIDGNLQFSSTDEHRYHEALVHPAMALATALPTDRGLTALVLGGGDGLALRELLIYEDLERIDLVDLDPVITDLFAEHPALRALNREAFDDSRVIVHNADAMEWLVERRRRGETPFDLIVVDLPDPNNFSLGKLYTRSFYQLVRSQLHPSGFGVVQATSPYLAPRSFWCVVKTLDASGLHPLPYHAHVPSFGDWGFVLVSPRAFEAPTAIAAPRPLAFLTDAYLPTLFEFPADQAPANVEINRLNDQRLVHYYESDVANPLIR